MEIMKVYTILKNLVQSIKSSLAEAKDYADSVISSQTELYSGSWTASSTNANNIEITQAITVPSGYYAVILKAPIFSGTYSMHLLAGSSQVANGIVSVSNCGTGICFLKLTADSTRLVIRSSQSASCTFSYLERGGIFALKIAEVGGVILNHFRRVVVA